MSLDPIGKGSGDSDAEFLAVATQVFLKKPEQLSHRHGSASARSGPNT